jgi:hypothetical protein
MTMEADVRTRHLNQFPLPFPGGSARERLAFASFRAHREVQGREAEIQSVNDDKPPHNPTIGPPKARQQVSEGVLRPNQANDDDVAVSPNGEERECRERRVVIKRKAGERGERPCPGCTNMKGETVSMKTRSLAGRGPATKIGVHRGSCLGVAMQGDMQGMGQGCVQFQ